MRKLIVIPFILFAFALNGQNDTKKISKGISGSRDRAYINETITKGNNLVDSGAVTLDTLQAIRIDVNLEADTTEALRADIDENRDTTVAIRLDLNASSSAVGVDTIAAHRADINETRDTTVVLRTDVDENRDTAIAIRTDVNSNSDHTNLNTIGIFTHDQLEQGVANSIGILPYDATNSEHWLIDSDADFDSINSTVKRFFYVEPGDYTQVTLTADGTELSKRYLSLHNTNDIHPALLDSSLQADVDLVVDSANYWVIDRLSSINSANETSIFLTNSSSNILFNRINIKYLNSYGFLLRGPALPSVMENVTIQNCRIGPPAESAIEENFGIIIAGETTTADRNFLNLKFVDNEIYNCNDGIQISRPSTPVTVANAAGLLIARNLIYIDSTVYLDTIGGSSDADGLYSDHENAIDLKFGSTDSTNKVVIRDNIMSGFRKSNGDNGIAIVLHFGVRYVDILDNIIYNSNGAIAASGVGDFGFTVDSCIISGNIMYNIGYEESGIGYKAYLYNSNRAHFEDNIMRDTSSLMSRWFEMNNTEVDLWVNDNVVIDAAIAGGTRSATTTVENNWHYETTMRVDPGDGTFYDDEDSAHMSDITFTVDNYTNSTRNVTLDNVVTTPLSPHFREIVLSNNAAITNTETDTVFITEVVTKIEGELVVTSTAIIDSVRADAITYTDTYWDDLRMPLTNTYLTPTKSEPEFEDTGDGIFAFAFDTGNDSTESLHFIAQLPHNYKEGTDLEAHIHWMPSSTNTDDVVWKLFYKTFPEGHAVSAITALDSARVVVAANGTALSQQETELATIDGTNLKISGMIIGNITRLGDAADDDFSGIVYGLEFDFHYEIDAPGSTHEEGK